MSIKIFFMLTRVYLLVVVAFCATSMLSAQHNDTWTTPVINDDMTVAPDLNKKWRNGEFSYSSKPKNAFEVGVHVGHFHINGDVPSDPPDGLGVGLHVRKSLNYLVSARIGGMWSTNSGLDGRLTSRGVLALDNRDLFIGENGEKFPNDFRTYRNYKTTNLQGSLELLFNFGNLLFHRERNRWNLYLGLGLGLTRADVKMNYLNGDTPYDWTEITNKFPKNTRAKRAAIAAALDGSFESSADNNRDVEGGFFDNGLIFPSAVLSLGVSRKITKRFNISLEHQVWAQDFDKWDGHIYRTIYDQTNDSDVGHYTNLRFVFNIGNYSKVTEPLYWINPIDRTYSDIAALKQRPILDLTDADEDGVLDFLDQDTKTEKGAPVDTRGVALDSDSDGVIDLHDKEPFSRPGFSVDKDGVAQIPDPGYLNEGDVNNIVDIKIAGLKSALAESACGNWFLPMIHFDLDKYYIKPEFYGQLHHVAEVMKKCPTMCITVEGHTDSRNSNKYNQVLSYNRAKAAVDYLVANYGISKDRFTLMYGGEEAPLIKNVPERGSSEVAAQQYMNRRVEFRVCEATDSNMSRPEGPEAGSGYRSGGKSGGNYGGNKNSGY